jgi:hypothetical protein
LADERSVIRAEHERLRGKYLELRATGYLAGADHGARPHAFLDQPIAISLDILVGRDDGSDLLDALARLAAAYGAARRLGSST